MTEIMIPMGGNASKHGDIELKYALRSICKYVPENNVTLVGYKPAWYRGRHMPASDIWGKKDLSIAHKVKKYIETTGMQDLFLFTNDDIFFQTDKVGIDYRCGFLSENIERSNEGYRKKIKATIELIGQDSRFYDVHTPMDVFPQLFNYCWERFLSKVGHDIVFKSVYKSIECNSFGETSFPHLIKEIKDCKINRPMPMDELRQEIAGRPFFSVGDKGLTDNFVDLLYELYPVPSKYE